MHQIVLGQAHHGAHDALLTAASRLEGRHFPTGSAEDQDIPAAAVTVE